MNIFILDENIKQSAEYHVDKHVVKMPLETAQLLCTTHWISKYIGHATDRFITKDELAILREAKKTEPRPFPYLPVMPNHPCTIWVRSSMQNYMYLLVLGIALGKEYTYRYGKTHKSVEEVIKKLPNIDLPDRGLTPFAQAMPDEYKNGDAIQAYRKYYLQDKYNLFAWKNREVPEWIST